MEKYEVLKKYFGYDGFRSGQEELIDSILTGRDVLGIMPTGAGKSLCYQVPALMLPGITLVISPLISLMMDQVKALNQAGIHAAYINSSLTENQVAKALQYASEGRYKIIYVAPERLETDSFLNFADRASISMVTVDEAHCISQWGQDFRPSYLKIVKFIQGLRKRPVVSAFTATATQIVKEDIICVLGLCDPQTLITGFDRENLYFEVKQEKSKNAFLLDYVTRHKEESGIIYCSTRKNVDNICIFLEEMGIDVTKYHAGLGNEERKHNQEDFIYDRKPVMVATNAFGMGIDKSNVRYVVHYNMPQSLENYYQEAGRAGRDGEPSECLILYSAQDIMINRFLIEKKEENQELTREELEAILENDEARLRVMTNYCTTKKCLREYILNYFGEFGAGEKLHSRNCGNCSNCLTQFEVTDVTEIALDIIQCVKDSGQRYGINVIVGVLRGENKAKLRNYGLTEAATFGRRQGMEEGRLKDIIHEMVDGDYLQLTKDKYMLVRLGTCFRKLSEEGAQLTIKCLKQEQIVSGTKTENKSKRHRMSDILTSRGLELFERLREKRLEIAREEAVPPYIVFSDKTLLDMCIKAPSDKAAMLQVSGVGELKYDRYGEPFLQCILGFRVDEQEIFYFPEEDGSAPVVETSNRTKGKSNKGERNSPGDVRQTGAAKVHPGDGSLVLLGVAEKTKTKGKTEFIMTEEIAQQIHYSAQTTLSDLVGQINDLRDDKRMKRLTNKAVMQKLVENGYVEELNQDGIWHKLVSQKGEQLGIFTEKRVTQAGTEYDVLYYREEAQHELVRKLLGEWRFLMN